MFGMKMLVRTGDLEILLRPFAKEDLPELTREFQSLMVHWWTEQTFGQVLENEQEWYDRIRHSETDCVWAIELLKAWDHKVPKTPIGVTAIHEIDRWGSCKTGIVIWDHKWWGLGIAGATHLARTQFAADFLNRTTIHSSVRVKNKSSLGALEKVGYFVWGVEPASCFRWGKWVDTYHLTWLNPEKVSLVYPEGLPKKLKKPVEKARKALEVSRDLDCVAFPC